MAACQVQINTVPVRESQPVQWLFLYTVVVSAVHAVSDFCFTVAQKRKTCLVNESDECVWTIFFPSSTFFSFVAMMAWADELLGWIQSWSRFRVGGRQWQQITNWKLLSVEIAWCSLAFSCLQWKALHVGPIGFMPRMQCVWHNHSVSFWSHSHDSWRNDVATLVGWRCRVIATVLCFQRLSKRSWCLAMLQMMNEVNHAYDCEHYIISEVSDVESPRRVSFGKCI